MMFVFQNISTKLHIQSKSLDQTTKNRMKAREKEKAAALNCVFLILEKWRKIVLFMRMLNRICNKSF